MTFEEKYCNKAKNRQEGRGYAKSLQKIKDFEICLQIIKKKWMGTTQI